MKKSLIIFNLEMDLESQVLAAAHDWVESFARNFDEVLVFSTHVGRVLLPINVHLKEIGGGSLRKRVIAIFRLLNLIRITWKTREEVVVLHHMSTYTAVIAGFFFRIIGIKQGLWYSHSVKSFSYSVATRIVNVIYSSYPDSLPTQPKKAKYIGHGINANRFLNSEIDSFNRNGVVSIGRYAPIKKYEKFLFLAHTYPNLRFHIYGPNDSFTYKQFLRDKFQKDNANISFQDGISYNKIPQILSTFDYFYSGTPKSVDKAAIEAAMSGCLVLSENSATIEVTGMGEVWNFIGINCPPSVEGQLIALENSANLKGQMRKILVSASNYRNDLESLTMKISTDLVRLSEESK